MLIRILQLTKSDTLKKRLLRILSTEDVTVSAVAQGDGLWKRLGEEGCDLVIASPSSLPEPVPESMAGVRELPDRPELVIVAPSLDPESVARFQAAGAFAVVEENLSDDALKNTLHTVIARRREGALLRLRERQARTKYSLGDFASHSPAMERVLALAGRVATSNSSLLILGETGVGKEWMARAIHAESFRAAGPFIPVNCAAIPESLLESELFGHEKGAFTGAIRARRGHFELAHQGTLFLDEIGEMSPHLQARLLRALQERRIQRVGAERSIGLDVRIMAATHRDPDKAMDVGTLRRDLYYRLAVVTLTIPPLRDRREDVLPLIETYLDQFRVQLGRPQVYAVSEEATAALLAYAWPGNVRELINVMERAVLLCTGEEITTAELPESLTAVDPSMKPRLMGGSFEPWLDMPIEAGRREIMTAFEREYLKRSLERNGGSIGETAKTAGINPRTLYTKMRLYGLSKSDFSHKTR